jgi:hypothetical protein
LYAKTNIVKIIVTEEHLDAAIRDADKGKWDYSCACIIAKAFLSAGCTYAAIGGDIANFQHPDVNKGHVTECDVPDNAHLLVMLFDTMQYSNIRTLLPLTFEVKPKLYTSILLPA